MKSRQGQSFKIERDFGSSIKDRFPDLEVTEDVTSGAVLILDIKGSRGLAMWGLSNALRRASLGGIRDAVVTLAGQSPTLVPIDRFRRLVDEELALKDQFRIEGLLRACA